MRRPAHLLITIARDARRLRKSGGERLRRGAADLGEQGERVGARGFQLCGGAGGIEPCGRIRLQEQCVFRQLARVGAPAPGREHALVDRDEAPERAQAVQVLAAARKPVEDAGRVRGEAVALEDVERFCGGVHGMDGHDAARARLRGAGGHDAVEGAELRRARRCMGAREVEPDFAHEFVGGGLGGRPRSRLLAGRARLDAPGMEPGSDTHVGCRGEALARCRVLGRCERGVEQGDTALPYGGCDFWAVRHVAQVAVHVDEAIAPAGGASSPEGFAFPRTSDGASARPPASRAAALTPCRPCVRPACPFVRRRAWRAPRWCRRPRRRPRATAGLLPRASAP